MEATETPDQDADRAPVVNIDFRRYFRALRKFVWLVASMVIVGIACAVIYAVRVTPIYEGKASVQIEPRLPDLLGTGDMFNLAAAGANTNEYYKQQRQVLGSYTLCKQTIEQFDLISKLLDQTEIKGLSHDDAIDLATRRLVLKITVTYPEQDRIMYVAVRDPNAQLATDIANDQVTTYINYSKGLLSMNSTQASEALQAEFNEAETKLRAAENKIYKFEAENDMITVTLEEHQNLVSQNILNLSQKLNDARASEIGIAAKLAEMKKEGNADTLSSPIIMLGDNPSFQTLRTQYFTEKTHLIELEKDLGGKNPDYLAQKQKVDELYKALEGELKILVHGTQDLYAAATSTTSGIAAEVEKYKDEARRLSPKILEYNELAREKKQIEDGYNILRARLSTTQMTGNMSSVMSNVHPLDPALLPTKPVSPNMPIDIGIAAAVSLLLGLTVVLLYVYFDRSIKTTTDAMQAAGVPVLGIIPALTESDVNKDDVRARDMYIHDHPTSHIAECCRVLRTNIMFSAADSSLKTIVVSSANAKEGKTTTVIYLGITMAQSGQRVLLVDTDMRRPRLHISTGVPREPGMSNLILGAENYDDVIKATSVPNLYVLPCGPLPPNPAELLLTKRFETVLAELGKRFTRIILDSPPLQPVTDAVVLAKRADGVILVARSGSTIRDELARASRMVRSVGPVLGVVVNELDRRERDSYYYYSYYGYSQNHDGPSEAA